MTFEEILDQTIAMLQRRGRLTYGTLRRQFQLDDAALEDLKNELIEGQRLAVDERGTVLVWIGAAGPASPAPSPSATTQELAPLTYTPPYLAEKILTSRGALEGERKQVTVLFADLKGSMELLADRDPEEARQLLDPVLERMMTAVHRYEGTVNQVMGDGIMALFGAPIAHEDHAVRACYAALAMQAAVKQYAAEVQRTKGVPLHIRVGLNSGEVVVRSIGSDLHMDYTAVGQTTHLAARMEQIAMPGTTLISADTLRLVEGYAQVTPLGPVAVKGLSEAVAVCELVSAAPIRTPLQILAARGLTRFVGRDDELDQLRQALERVPTGHGQVVSVIGEPGVGKTRLFYEFTRSHRTYGWLILESRSLSWGKATPYQPILDLLRDYYRIEDHDDTRTMREKVTGKLLTLDTALGPTIPAFLTLLDAAAEDAQWQALDPPQRRQRILDAIKHLLLRESQEQPLLLVFENLHWIDTETQAILDSLVESLPTARILLLVNYRPEYQHGWGNKTYYTQLRLDPLPHQSAREFLQVLLGDDASLTPLKRFLIERTEGNPFFLEESVRALVEPQVLVGERGAYRLAKPMQSLQVPATVQAVLAARIDRLPPEEKRLLQVAAVVGTEVPFALLQAIVDLPAEAQRRGLAHLQAAEFLYETRLFPELEYTFKHALTHEVAYASLLHERRRAFHGRIVEAIEALHPDRLAEQLDRLAHHALRGEVWDKAFGYCRQVGAKAMERSAHREALVCYEQALTALRHLPETRETVVAGIDVRVDLRNALLATGEHERIFSYLREAQTLAEALVDQRRLGRVFGFMAAHFNITGRGDEAIAAGHRALALGTALGDTAIQIGANQHLGLAYFSLGGYRQAMEFLGRNIASLEGKRLYEIFGRLGLPSVISRLFMAGCLGELGVFTEGGAHAEEATRIAEAVDHSYSRLRAYSYLGGLYLRQGELQKAIPVLERGFSLSQVANITVVPIVPSLSLAYALAGRKAEAQTLLAQGIEQLPAWDLGGYWSPGSLLGETHLLVGLPDQALAQATRALDSAARYRQRAYQGWALRLLGEIAVHRDPPEFMQAVDYYRQALALAEELGMRPLQAHCHRGLGTLYATTGQREQARTALAAAIDLYRAMDMTFWLPQAEAALAEVEGR
jgi:class 3 adenylate cyclase/tetratricopeptide (TPR) repeat protein